MVWYGMVWYGMVWYVVASDYLVGPLGRVGQRLLLRGVLLAPNQIIVRINLGPRIALGEVRYRLKIIYQLSVICMCSPSIASAKFTRDPSSF